MAVDSTNEEYLHELFENEIEGKVYSQESIHKLFIDDGLNDRMDQILKTTKEQKQNIFVSFWRYLFEK